MIGRARTGDVAAYETLVRRYQDVAMRTAYLVAPEADAADAVQDAFVKAYAALPRFRLDAPLRPWLLRIVTNEARNRRRSADRRSGLALRAAVAAPRNEMAPSPESSVLAAEARGELVAAIGRLRDEEREVIGARYFLALGNGTTATAVVVNGRPGYWLSGDPHFLFYTGPNGFVHEERRWVGEALIWAVGPITYRLETSLGRDAAIRLAESMP